MKNETFGTTDIFEAAALVLSNCSLKHISGCRAAAVFHFERGPILKTALAHYQTASDGYPVSLISKTVADLKRRIRALAA